MLLDVGCGRGEFANSFQLEGLEVFGLDGSDEAKSFFPELTISVADIDHDPFSYQDDHFDTVFSKSMIEHLNVEKFLRRRLGIDSGTLITLCPSWEFNYKMFYDDFTHRTPFTLESLRDIQSITGFENIDVEFFKQLPLLWGEIVTIICCLNVPGF